MLQLRSIVIHCQQTFNRRYRSSQSKQRCFLQIFFFSDIQSISNSESPFPSVSRRILVHNLVYGSKSDLQCKIMDVYKNLTSVYERLCTMTRFETKEKATRKWTFKVEIVASRNHILLVAYTAKQRKPGSKSREKALIKFWLM